jgi:hypothetical protein
MRLVLMSSQLKEGYGWMPRGNPGNRIAFSIVEDFLLFQAF